MKVNLSFDLPAEHRQFHYAVKGETYAINNKNALTPIDKLLNEGKWGKFKKEHFSPEALEFLRDIHMFLREE